MALLLVVAGTINGIYAAVALIGWLRGAAPDRSDRMMAIIGCLTMMAVAFGEAKSF